MNELTFQLLVGLSVAMLIVGIWGMNVKGLPLTDSDNGFIWVMLLSIACSAATYWLLKRAPRLFRGSGFIR